MLAARVLAWALSVYDGRHRDRERALVVSEDRGVDRRRGPATMRDQDDDVGWRDRVVLEEPSDVAFGPLEPEQLANSSGTQHVPPHQARIRERVQRGERAI